MTWNHRVVLRQDGTHEIVEAHYDSAGRVIAVSAYPASVATSEALPNDEAIASLRVQLERMTQALSRPIFVEPAEWGV